jgi:hypothetical protein
MNKRLGPEFVWRIQTVGIMVWIDEAFLKLGERNYSAVSKSKTQVEMAEESNESIKK